MLVSTETCQLHQESLFLHLLALPIHLHPDSIIQLVSFLLHNQTHHHLALPLLSFGSLVVFQYCYCTDLARPPSSATLRHHLNPLYQQTVQRPSSTSCLPLLFGIALASCLFIVILSTTDGYDQNCACWICFGCCMLPGIWSQRFDWILKL